MLTIWTIGKLLGWGAGKKKKQTTKTAATLISSLPDTIYS